MPELSQKMRAFQNTTKDMKAAAVLLDENKEVIRKSAAAYAYDYDYASTAASTTASTADAKKLREDIAREAIKSLRLAIEIK